MQRTIITSSHGSSFCFSITICHQIPLFLRVKAEAETFKITLLFSTRLGACTWCSSVTPLQPPPPPPPLNATIAVLRPPASRNQCQTGETQPSQSGRNSELCHTIPADTEALIKSAAESFTVPPIPQRKIRLPHLVLCRI